MPKGKYLTDEQKTAITESYLSGKTCTEVADLFGLSTKAVLDAVKLMGTIRPRLPLTDQYREAMVAQYVAGQSCPAIAQEYNVSAFYVAKQVKIAGVMRDESFRSIRNRQIIEAYLSDQKITQIAKDFRLPADTITTIIRKAGKTRPQKRINEEVKLAIAEAYRQGDSTLTIATNFEVCQISVQKIIKEIDGQLRKRFTTEAERRAILQAYESGQSSYAIARTFGISRPSVCDIVKNAGLTIRGCYKLTDDNRRLIITDYQAGAFAADLARQYSIANTHICRILKQAGIAIRRGETLTDQQKSIRLHRYRLRANAIRGEKSHFWKGGRTKLQQTIRTTSQYYEWRRAILLRDNKTCQHCGAKGWRVRLEIDHKYPFSAILTDFNIRTRDEAIACGALWETDNGQTLCQPCHKKTPTYGNKAQEFLCRSVMS